MTTMEKGEFGQIRNAVHEYAEYTQQDYQTTIDFFRELKALDKKVLSDAIVGLSGIREVKNEVGNELYGLFTSVAAEKEKQLQTADERLSQILSMSSGEARNIQMLQYVSWVMDESEKEIRSDERIRAGFSGKEEELDALINTTKLWMKSMFGHFALTADEDQGTTH